MTLVGNVYELYGDIWEDVPNWQQKWLGRYHASAVAIGESRDYSSSEQSAVTPVTMRFDVVVEFGSNRNSRSADYKDSLVIGGTQDLTISDIPAKAGKPETIYFLDNDLAILGGAGYWQGATGFLKYYDTGSITAGSTLIAGQEVDTLKAESEATFYVYRPCGGLSMSA